MIDIQGIKEALPHRYPMLLVDRVFEVSEDTIVAIKNVTINEPFFNGHFPSIPSYAWSPHYGSLGSDSRCVWNCLNLKTKETRLLCWHG